MAGAAAVSGPAGDCDRAHHWASALGEQSTKNREQAIELHRVLCSLLFVLDSSVAALWRHSSGLSVSHASRAGRAGTDWDADIWAPRLGRRATAIRSISR